MGLSGSFSGQARQCLDPARPPRSAALRYLYAGADIRMLAADRTNTRPCPESRAIDRVRSWTCASCGEAGSLRPHCDRDRSSRPRRRTCTNMPIVAFTPVRIDSIWSAAAAVVAHSCIRRFGRPCMKRSRCNCNERTCSRNTSVIRFGTR